MHFDNVDIHRELGIILIFLEVSHKDVYNVYLSISNIHRCANIN